MVCRRVRQRLLSAGRAGGVARFARGGVDGCSPVLYRGARSGQRANNIGRPRGRVLLALYAFERWRSGMTRTCDLRFRKPFSAQQCCCLKFVALQCVACTATATLRSQIYPRPRTSALRQKLPLAGAEIQLPLYPRKQTQLGNRAMSEKCHERTHAPRHRGTSK